MSWLHVVACFFGGAFFANAIPHVVSGVMGQAFQTPFADPPGQGRSSSTLNVVWGFLNAAVSYVLLCRISAFDVQATGDIVAAGAGALLLSLFAARHFGRVNGGNLAP